MSARDFLRRHREKRVPLLIALIALVALAIFWHPLTSWFSGNDTAADDLALETPSAQPEGGDAPSAPDAGANAPAGAPTSDEPPRGPPRPTLPPGPLPDPVFAKVEAALAPYEEIRALLAGDGLGGVDRHALALEALLREAHEEAEGPLAEVLEGAAESAEGLRKEEDLATARVVFGMLSKYLVALGDLDPRLTEGRFVFECPMTKSFNKWIQPSAKLANPYMGAGMLTCGSRSDWSVAASEPPAAEAGHAHGGAADEIAYYTCPMHPSVKQSGPGACPICGMDLVPVTKEELESGSMLVDEGRRQRIGVKLAEIGRRPMVLPIRAVGEVVYDQTKLHDVSLRMGGWIQRLVVDKPGERVRRGDVLFTLYSPELYAAQLEYLNAVRTAKRGDGALGATAEALSRAARQKLHLLGMPAWQIDALARRGEPWEDIPIHAPASGYVIDKNVVEGTQLPAGTQVYRIADLDRVWVEAEVYESDLPYVRVGQPVEIALPYVPGRTWRGTVGFIYPYLQETTRTGQVRVELENPELALKPAMYANLTFQADLGQRLVVPSSAVLYTGTRRIVFVDVGEDRLEPRVVTLGARAGDYHEVLEGLEAGDRVVTSGNFLLSSESRLKSAAGLWEGDLGNEAP